MSERSKHPTQRGHAQLDDDAPTTVDPSARFRDIDAEGAEPIQVVSVKAQHESGPVAVSMKTPMHRPEREVPATTPVLPRPKLRAMSEITPLPNAQPRNLGYLAPPRDPTEVRSRRMRDIVIWSCLAVILASGVALAIWFLAR